MARIDWKGRRQELEALLAEGAGLRELSEHFGTNMPAVSQTLRRFGLYIDPDAARSRRIMRVKRLNTDPQCIVARSKACAEANRRPERRAASGRWMSMIWNSPTRRESLVAKLKTNLWSRPELIETRKRAAAASLSARMSWCPADRREEYRRIRARFGAAEAKRIILDDLTAKERARLVAMTPFERQLERVRNGARLEERITLVRPDHHLTLGGVASGMLA